MMGLHYKGKATIGRLPLVHIAIGSDETDDNVTPVAVLAVGARA